MEDQLIIRIPKRRLENLKAEFYEALSKLESEEIKKWGRITVKIFLKNGKRRMLNAAKTIGKAGKIAITETYGYTRATRNHQLSEHFSKRKVVYKNVTIKTLKQSWHTLSLLIQYLKTNPSKAAPQIFLAFIGFLVGSGGFDGDGGLPDTDIMAGIGYHRSIWTHSIFMALFIETIAYSLVKLVELFYDKLPEHHDRFWDKLMENQKQLTRAFANGACAGIAYHLLVDMNITADSIKPYADLPFSTSMETHQAILGGNAVVEIVDIHERNKHPRG